MNFVFDIGNVLVDYNPAALVDKLFADKSLAEKMLNSIFRSSEWADMDMGNLSREKATEVSCTRMPEHKSEILLTMQSIHDIFIPNNDVIKLLPIIKKAGHGLFYLSNMHVEIRDFLLANHEYFSMLDGGVFSCDVHLVKPSPEIYRHFLNKYRLVAGECIFFDDVEDNVTAAEKEGIKSVLFTTADCVLSYMQDYK